MNKVIGGLPRVLGVALAWAILWMTFWAIVAVIIGVVDPDSIDPGEGLAGAAIFGSMGILSGVILGILLVLDEPRRPSAQLSLGRAAGWGTLASAVAQIPYLGHGDQGLVANIKIALLFSAIGGLVMLAWLALARGWSRRRSPLSTS